MYLGQIVEVGPTEDIIRERLHPYTRLLLEASPEPDPSVVKPPLEARGEIPSPVDLPNGCRFHPRCPYALAPCGWEGRAGVAAAPARRLAGTEPPADAAVERDGLNVIVSARH